MYTYDKIIIFFHSKVRSKIELLTNFDPKFDLWVEICASSTSLGRNFFQVRTKVRIEFLKKVRMKFDLFTFGHNTIFYESKYFKLNILIN